MTTQPPGGPADAVAPLLKLFRKAATQPAGEKPGA